MAYYVRQMRQEDVLQVTEIDREGFPTQWPPADYQHELRNRLAHYIVVCDDETMYERPETVAPLKAAGLISRLKRLFGHPRFSRDELATPDGHYIIGFAGFWIMADEAHIINIAVREAYRRQGLGELLLISSIDLARELKASLVTLEVRASNTAAQGLYTKYGFKQMGTRKGYYIDRGYPIDNREDGLIMTTEDINLDTFQAQLGQLKQAYSRRWGIAPAQIERWLSIRQ